MGLADFADTIAPPKKKDEEKSGLLGFAARVAPPGVEKPAAAAEVSTQKPAGKKSGLVAFAEEVLPSDAGSREWAVRELLKQAPAPYEDLGYGKPPAPPMMMTTPEGRQYPAPQTTGFTRVGGMVAQQIPFFKPLTEALSGKPGAWEEIAPQGAGEKALGAAIDFAGFLGPAAMTGGLAAKGVDKLLEKGLGKMAPTLFGTAARRFAEKGINLGVAGVAKEIFSGENIKEATKAFGPYAVMGEIFGLTGLFHFTKHPVVSQLIRQVGGRVLLDPKFHSLDKEAWSGENIGQTLFHELLNTAFLAKGETAKKAFAGAIAHGRALQFIESMPRAERPSPEVVKAAGGPAGWLNKTILELQKSLEQPAGTAAAPLRAEPSILYSKTPKQENILDIRKQPGLPGMAEPEAVEPVAPAGRARPGDRWQTDPGAIPGEPAHTLDGIGGNEKAAIFEVERGDKVLFEAMLPFGKSIGKFQTLQDAARAAEEYVDAHPESQEFSLEPTKAAPAPFSPGGLAGRQGVLPMAEASPLFQAAAPVQKAEPVAPKPATAPTAKGVGVDPGEIQRINKLQADLQSGKIDARTYMEQLVGSKAQAGPSLESLRPELEKAVSEKLGEGELEAAKTVDELLADDFPKNGITTPERAMEFIEHLAKFRAELAKATTGEEKAAVVNKYFAEEPTEGKKDILYSRPEVDDVLTRELLQDRKQNPHHRLQGGKERAEWRRSEGLPDKKKRQGPSKLTDRAVNEAMEDRVIEETTRAILEGAATFDALDPAYRKLLKRRMEPAELDALKRGVDYQALPLAERIALTRKFDGLPEGPDTEAMKASEAERKARKKAVEKEDVEGEEGAGPPPTGSGPGGKYLNAKVYRGEEVGEIIGTTIPTKPGEEPIFRVRWPDKKNDFGTLSDLAEQGITLSKTETKPPAPLGRAPQTLTELESELVRINEGRVTPEMSRALTSLVKAFAEYKGMTPDEYVAARFAGLEASATPSPGANAELQDPIFRGMVINDLSKRGITDPKMVQKVLDGEPIAAVEFLADGKAVIRAFRRSNVAGMAHELGHVFRRDLSPAERNVVEKACGVVNGKWDRYSEERWAKQFELYLRRGKAPNQALAPIFEKFKKWLGAIYENVKAAFGKNARIHPNVSLVLDKVLGGKEIPPEKVLGQRPKADTPGRASRPRRPASPGEPPPGVEWPEGAAPPGGQAPPGKPGRKPEATREPAVEFEPDATKEPPHGPTLTGRTISEADPPVKVLGDKSGGATLTLTEAEQAIREMKAAASLPWGKLAKGFKNPQYIFDRLPFFKKHIRQIDVTADHQRALAKRDVDNQVKGWRESLAPGKGREAGRQRLGSEFRIWTYAIAQQGKAGLKTLEAMGITDIPTLTPAEMKVYTEVRKNLEGMYKRINEARTLLGLDPIGHIENYFTFLRKGEELEEMGHQLIEDVDAKALTDLLNKPSDPAFFKRRGRGGKPIESKLFNIYQWYMSRAEKYIQKAPVLANSKLLLEAIEYKDADGKKQRYTFSFENKGVANIIKDYVNFTVGEKTPSALVYVFGESGRKVANYINRSLGAAVLSANIRSALIQPSSLRNSYIELGRKWLYEGVKQAAFKPAGYKEAIEKSEVLLGRFFDIHQAMMVEGPAMTLAKASELKKNLAKVGVAPMQFLDLSAAVFTWQGAYRRALAPKARGGLEMGNEVEARRYADDAVTRTQASGAARDLAPFQRTPEGRLAATFQTFVINEWNYLADKVGPNRPEMSNTERFWNIYRMVIGTAIVNAIMEDVLKMRSPFPTPERAIAGGIKDEEKAGKILVDVVREFGEQIPILGGSIRWSTPNRTALPATAQLGSDTIKAATRVFNALSQHDPSKLNPADLTIAGQWLGVPGTSQMLKTIRRRQQGGTWPQALLGTRMEKLGKKVESGLSEADRILLRKYNLEHGMTPEKARIQNQELMDELRRKYGARK